MRKVTAFMQVSVDGYYADADGDMSWAHKSDPEWDAFVEGNASGGGPLLFGRTTYDQMASFWPTPMALQVSPVVAAQMNEREKVVVSRRMKKASWNNTRVVKDLAADIRAMKAEPGRDVTILGSGSIVSQLLAEGLLDSLSLVVNPIVLGGGKTMFEGLRKELKLRPTTTRTFANGNVLLAYDPMA